MIFMQSSIWRSLMPLIFLDILCLMVKTEVPTMNSNDPHGGVPMGVSNAGCDNGKENIEIDWNPKSTEEYTCTEGMHKKLLDGKNYFNCDKKPYPPLHICYPHVINYTEDLPTSGRHRPVWPKYGEYIYVPAQRWLHSLEHGAVVFLYHPCADSEEIQVFKSVAKNCLHRHIISPYKKLPPEMNFALLTWTCKLVLSKVDVPTMVEFVKSRALHGPEMVSTDGQYDIGLLQPAKIVSDIDDSQLCPTMSVISATEFRDRSLARRAKSQRSQNYLENIMRAFMEEFQK